MGDHDAVVIENGHDGRGTYPWRDDSPDSATALKSIDHIADDDRLDWLLRSVGHHHKRATPDAFQIVRSSLIFLLVFFVITTIEFERSPVSRLENTSVSNVLPSVTRTENLLHSADDLLKLRSLTTENERLSVLS